MKQKRFIKMILILILFLTFGFIKTIPCFAWNNGDYWDDNQIDTIVRQLQNNGNVRIRNSDLKTSNYIFCRNFGTSLAYGTKYTLDTTQHYGHVYYPIITYYTGNFDADGKPTGNVTTDKSLAKSCKVEGADKAYILAQFEPDTKPGESAYSYIQHAYWAILGQEAVSNLDKDAKKLYDEAILYQKFINTVEKFKINNNQNSDNSEQYYDIIINTEKAKTSINSDNIFEVGPITIDYPGEWDSTNAISMGTIRITFKKQDGNNLKIYDLGLKDEDLYVLENDTKKIVDTTNFVTFEYYDADGNVKTNNAKIDLNTKEIFTDTSTINTRKGITIKFNLNKLNSSINKLEMCVNTKIKRCSAEVYFIKGTYEYSGETVFYCMNCQTNTSANGIIDYDGKKYVNDGTITIFEDKLTNHQKYYIIGKGESGPTITPSATTRKTYYRCDACWQKGVLVRTEDYPTLSYHLGLDHKPRATATEITIMSYKYVQTRLKPYICGVTLDNGYRCGVSYNINGEVPQQQLIILRDNNNVDEIVNAIPFEIPLSTSIEVTKNWSDYSNKYQLRPDTVSFNVYRSTNQNATTWEKLIENTDYKVEWKITTGNNWKAIIGGLKRTDNNGNKYYFKVEERPLDYYDVTRATYSSGSFTDGRVEDTEGQRSITIDNKLKYVKIGGYVWLDGQTGIKPAVPYNGNMDSSEEKLKDIVVYLYYKDPTTDVISRIAQTKTNSNGHYQFETKTRRR